MFYTDYIYTLFLLSVTIGLSQNLKGVTIGDKTLVSSKTRKFTKVVGFEVIFSSL